LNGHRSNDISNPDTDKENEYDEEDEKGEKDVKR
jgi:hypothetical protein